MRIRAAKAAGDVGPWTVRVAPGMHAVASTLVFTPEDSEVTWAGDAGKGSVLSGGVRLGPWRDLDGGVWAADAPKGPDGRSVWFEQLWIGGRRAERARLPDTGYFHVAGCAESQVGTNVWEHTATFTNDEVVAALKGLDAAGLVRAQMLAVHRWSFTRRTLRGFDAATATVRTRSPVKWERWGRFGKETLVWFENLRAGFDAPGEWLHEGDRILYRPLPGESPETLEALAPAGLTRLVEFRGDPQHGRYVDGVTFRNLTFEHTAGTPAAGAKTGGPSESFQHQAASGSDGAVMVYGARRLTFDGCTVRHTGNYAMRFGDGTFSNRVVGCTFEDVGAGGVWMGASQMWLPSGARRGRREIVGTTPMSSAFNTVEECLFRQGGRFNPEGTAVAFTHVSDSKVLHCDIYDFYYTGVSVGFTWGYRGSVAQRNEIAFNRIGNLGKGVMSDMGGIYTLGTSFGTTVHDNVVHDIESYSYGGRGLYADEGSEGIVFERNLVWNATSSALHQHYGVGCIYRGNIVAWSREPGMVMTSRRCVEDVPSSLHVVGNIVLTRGGKLVGDGVFNVPGVWANNLWYDVTGRADFGGRTFAEWQACGKETGGVYADPLFVDAERFDFRLRPESPAHRMGFREWDFSAAGRTRR